MLDEHFDNTHTDDALYAKLSRVFATVTKVLTIFGWECCYASSFPRVEGTQPVYKLSDTLKILYTIRYGPVRGLSSSSCGGLSLCRRPFSLVIGFKTKSFNQ